MFISAYGVYIPRKRVKVDELVKYVTGFDISLGVSELAVPALDDDSVSMAINSAKSAIEEFSVDPESIDALVFGTNTNPYVNKGLASIIIEALDLRDDIQTFELSCGLRTGIKTLVLGDMLLRSFKNVLCVTSECVRVKVGESIAELIPSSGSASFVLSQNGGFASMKHLATFNREFLDIWSCDGREYFFDRRSIRHTYERAFAELMERVGNVEYDTLVAQVPNTYIGMKLLRKMGVGMEKVMKGMTLTMLGNMFSVSPLIGIAKAFEDGASKIVVASCGSGGGDALAIDVAEQPEKKIFYQQFNDREYIDMREFLRLMGD